MISSYSGNVRIGNWTKFRPCWSLNDSSISSIQFLVNIFPECYVPRQKEVRGRESRKDRQREGRVVTEMGDGTEEGRQRKRE